MEEDNKYKNYGWLICAAGTLVLFCNGGLTFTGFSVFQPYLISVSGLTNTQVSLLGTIRNLFSFVGMLFVSRVIEKIELRRTLGISGIVVVAGFFLSGFMGNFTGYVITFVIWGIVHGMAGMVVVSVLISRWFTSHRGMAIGICMAATGLSSVVSSPVVTAIIEHSSLQMAFYTVGTFCFVAYVLIFLVVRSNPSCLNTQPIGGTGAKSEKGVFAPKNASKGIMAAMVFGLFIFGMPAVNITTHVSVLYSTEAYSSSDITKFLSLIGIGLAVGKCIYGTVADKIGALLASRIFYTFVVIGCFLCSLAGNGNVFAATAAVGLVGFGLAVTSVSASMYGSGVANEEGYGRAVTYFQMANMLGGLAFGTIPGIIADVCGSYVPSFVIMTVLAAAGALWLQVVYTKVLRENAKAMQERR